MYEKIIDFFKENEDLFNKTILELDAWNGYLGDDRFYEMETLSEFYRNCEPMELLTRAYYGYDLDSWSTLSDGAREYRAFNPNRSFFGYNIYGNLISTDVLDYTGRLDEYFIEELIDNRLHLTLDPEIEELLDELEEEEEEV